MASKILIVDDSVSIRQMVNFTLKESGYEVTEADKFDLIITDVNMPKMDGLDMLKNLRASDSNKFTPILLLTTESSSNKKAEGKAAGATGWIVKPFNPASLIATVNKVLN